MPTYTVKYSNFNLSQKQKNLLAREIFGTPKETVAKEWKRKQNLSEAYRDLQQLSNF